jgi:carboxyl-terminal processing protease
MQGKTQADVFERVSETVGENFYDPDFNGVDWKAVREKYRSQATKAKSEREFAAIVNQMLSELKTSHTRFYTAKEPEYYQLLGIFQPRVKGLQEELKQFFPKGTIEYSGIGIFTKEIDNKTFISAILDRSPASEAGLKVGDRILSVDGKPFEPIDSFVGLAGQKALVSIERSMNPPIKREIAVTPKMFDAKTMFLEAQRASTQIIDRKGKKIGYVRIWSYADDIYQEQLEDDLIYGRLRDADGLVLDLREGWGGASPNYLNIFTARGPSVTTIDRKGKKVTFNYQWQKPVVLLVNERSRSGKEILAFGFQKYKIGPVVGSKTPGAVVAGSAFLMPDGSLLYLAVANVFVDEKQRLEGKGIEPDINVPFVLEYSQGGDPQKERAIESVIELIQKNKN